MDSFKILQDIEKELHKRNKDSKKIIEKSIHEKSLIKPEINVEKDKLTISFDGNYPATTAQIESWKQNIKEFHENYVLTGVIKPIDPLNITELYPVSESKQLIDKATLSGYIDSLLDDYRNQILEDSTIDDDERENLLLEKRIELLTYYNVQE